MKARTSSRLAWSLWALYFPLAAGGKYLEAQTGELFGSFLESVALLAAFAVFATVGALIGARRPQNPIGWMMLAVALGGVFTAFAGAYATYALITRPGSLPAGWLMAWFQSWTWYPSIGLLFTFLIVLFPTGRLPSPRWRPLAWADGILIASLVLAAALAPEIEVGGEPEGGRVVIDNPIGVGAARGALDWLEGSAAGLTTLVVFGLGVASLFVRYRNVDRDQRQQLKWFLYAAALSILGMLAGELVPAWFAGNILFAALVSLIPISIAIAVLKHRLYDIDVVINKTLVYGALAGLITAVYVGVVVGLGTLIGSRGEPNLGLQIAATALVAVVFQPARQRVQRLANRVVYGKRAEPYQVMAEFGGRIASSIEVEEILPRTAEAAARGVGAARARVRVFLPDGTRREVVWPAEPDGAPAFDLTLPVVNQGQDVGEIAVTKAAGDPLRPAEESLLRDLASQAGLALHNVRLTSELRHRLEEISRQAGALRESQARIVTAADEERRRLERTIEDRVERSLGEIAAMLRQIVREGQDPRAAGAALDVLRGRAQETLDELREIARGIYPPLLADQGLAAALRAQARKAAVPVTVIAEGVPRLSAEVEASIYFCCLEALQNVAKYAVAREVAVVIDAEDGAVSFRIIDDGRGFDPTSPRRGLGLQNMRDRVEALGGTFELTSQPGEGTTIAGRIPLHAPPVAADQAASSRSGSNSDLGM